jgi:hypothetical protein
MKATGSLSLADPLRQLETARRELARREQQRPRAPRAEERAAIRSLGSDLKKRVVSLNHE